MADSKVTLAQLRAAAKKAGCDGLYEGHPDNVFPRAWYVFVGCKGKGLVYATGASKQKSRKLMLHVLKGMAIDE